MTALSFPLPPDTLRANARAGGHWGPVNKDKNAYKLACHAVINEVPWGEDNNQYPVHLTITAYLGYKQQADASDVGFWAKVPIDCLVEAGVFRDDGSKYVNPVTSYVRRDRARPRMTVCW